MISLVSLTEAVTNAILHGNGSDEAKHVSISCQHEKDSISVLVSDEGPGFDPAEVPDPTCPELRLLWWPRTSVNA
ncbi:MAG: ATP-binding protein [Saprospiraceae bacterium]